MKSTRTRLLQYGLIWALPLLLAAAPPPARYTETISTREGKAVSFEMILIPGGTFSMGSDAEEPGHAVHESPKHRVRLSPFYLCSTETTLELFLAYYEETYTDKKAHERIETEHRQQDGGVDAITGPTKVFGDMTMGNGHQHPAIGMTWNNATTFCRWLSIKTGRTYRLPTEAEWEYAARAGNDGPYGGVNAESLADYAWFVDNTEGPNPVAQKRPNAWGLYDMAGNVSEWVFDFYSPKAYAGSASNEPVVDPQGPATGRVHVARGGSYESPPRDLRCAARGFEEDFWRFGDPQLPKSKWWLPELDIIGVRVAASLEAENPPSSP